MNKFSKGVFAVMAMVAVTQASQATLPPQVELNDIIDGLILGDSIDLFAQGYGGGGGYDCNFNSNGSSGSTTNGTDADTTVELEVCGGDLTIDVPDTVSFGSLAVSATVSTASANIPFVQVNDLRGANAGWDVTATMTNFEGGSNSDIILLYDNSTSYLDLTAGTVSVDGSYGSLDGVSEFTSTQSTSGVSGTSSSDETDAFDIMGFSSGNGAGQYTVEVDMDLSILPYTYAQTYTATFTATVV